MAIQEAVELHSKLAADQPAVFNLHLAISIDHLSKCLSAVDCLEDTGKAAQEAVVTRTCT
jgi:hypothetical protein